MPYQPADPTKLAKMIEGHEDTISGPFRRELEAVLDAECPRCGGRVQAEPDIERMLAQGSTRYGLLSRCTTCGCLFNPDSGLIVELGNLGRIEPAIPLINPEEED